MMRLAVMQPYFIPYAGYFRLLCDVDAFVVLDCVQFTRRGWIHRNQLLDRLERPRWLTLPLERAPVTTSIHAMRLAPAAEETLLAKARRFRACTHPSDAAAGTVQAMLAVQGNLVDYLVRLLTTVCDALQVTAPPMVLSSQLALPAHLRGQDRILGICRSLGATHYLNAPGGKALYEPDAFARQGVSLEFLPTYKGANTSVLQRLHDDNPMTLRSEILRNRYA